MCLHKILKKARSILTAPCISNFYALLADLNLYSPILVIELLGGDRRMVWKFGIHSFAMIQPFEKKFITNNDADLNGRAQ